MVLFVKKNKLVHSFNSVLGQSPEHAMFDRSSKVTTAFNAGNLVPIYLDEILPGDNVDMDVKALVRQTTLLKPIMDSAYLDLFAYFVPNRIV